MRFKEQVVIVTGASSGIGEATAKAFAEEGASVIITGRHPERTKNVADSINAVYVGTGDIADSAYCRAFIGDIIKYQGKIDVLVNNAGMIVREDTVSTTDQQWFDTMGVNVNAVFFMSREVLKIMRQQGQGAIINVSSTCGLVGSKGEMAYSTSKGALIQMTRAMALDCAAEGIRVNAVCPGATDTRMLLSAHKRTPTREEMEKIQCETVPMKRMAHPDEVARPILFLASADASYITGAYLSVDGGYVCQ